MKNSFVAMENEFQDFGLVMVMMTVVITPMKPLVTVQRILANPPSSDVPMAGAFSTLGNVIMKMIVEMAPMNKIVITKIADLESSLVTTIGVSRTVKYVMESMIARITAHQMKPWKRAKTKM